MDQSGMADRRDSVRIGTGILLSRRRGHRRLASTVGLMSYVYRIEGSIAHAQPCAAGPWDPGLQHGGAPASLIAWAVERMPVREPMQVVRMTFDFLRPI